jgi:hypothetical protein
MTPCAGRAREDDGAAACVLDHRRDRDASGVEHALEVHVDHLVPLLVGRGGAAGADAGVGDDDGDGAELGDAVVERLPQRLRLAHVDLEGDHAAPEVLHQPDRLVDVLARRHRVHDRVQLAADVDAYDVGSLLCQPYRVRPTLAACGTGDERDLPFELPHVDPLLVSGRSSPNRPHRTGTR